MCGRRELALLAIAVLLTGGGFVSAQGHPGSCADCHITHESGPVADVPLWNTAYTADGLPVFTLYHSKSFDALHTDISQPDGASRLCLGCHDGSYPGLSADSGLVFGTEDLALSHPISFTYDSSLAMRVPTAGLLDPLSTPSGLGDTIDRDLLDEQHKLQCTSCHDVHETGYTDALLRQNLSPPDFTLLCRTCHNR